MADLTNRSRFRVTVRNRDDLTQHFSFNMLGEVEAYMAKLRGEVSEGMLCSARSRVVV